MSDNLTFKDFNITIENVKSNKKTCKFDIKGDKKYGFSKSIINGIRRVLLSDIPTVAINVTDINIIENTGKLHNEFLKDRISLIPLYLNPIDYNKNFLFTLDVEIKDTQLLNITADMFSIYPLKDEYLEVFNSESNDDIQDLLIKMKNNIPQFYNLDKPLDSVEKEKVFRPFKFRNYEPSYFLITELKNTNSNDINEKIKLNCVPTFGISKNHARWNNIPLAVYTFKKDYVILEKTIQENIKMNNIKNKKEYSDEFIINNSERYFHKDDNLEPYWYEFSLQSNHLFDCKDLFILSIDILLEKLNKIGQNLLILKNNVNDIDDDDEEDNRYKIKKLNKENTYSLIMNDENDTIGNIIQTHIVNKFIKDDSQIILCGYKKPHPLINKIIFNFMFGPTENNENYKKTYILMLIINVVKDLIEIFKKIKLVSESEL